MTTANKKISAKIRKHKKDYDVDEHMPAVLYGVKRDNMSLAINRKEFDKLYEEAGESTLITLDIEGEKTKPAALIYDIQKDPLKGNIIHADFYEPNLDEAVEAEIPVIFNGESPAVKDLEGTLVKNVDNITVKALPQNLPHEVEIDIGVLKTFDDAIYIKDLKVPQDVEIVQDPDWVVAMVSPPENVEEELEKPIEEGEEPEVISEREKEEAEAEDKESDSSQEEKSKEEDKKEE